MKYVIALKHFQTDPHGDHMLNLAYHYGILYQEQHGDMLFFFREELADKRTARFFGDLLCAIFQTQYADRTYAYPTQFEPRFQISIYDVLFAFFWQEACAVQKRESKSFWRSCIRKRMPNSTTRISTGRKF